MSIFLECLCDAILTINPLTRKIFHIKLNAYINIYIYIYILVANSAQKIIKPSGKLCKGIKGPAMPDMKRKHYLLYIKQFYNL